MNTSKPPQDPFDIIWENFQNRWNFWLSTYDVTVLVLMSLGLIGGIMALITLFRSPKTQTPSFTYHKALVSANLLYCVNWFILQVVDKKFGRKGLLFDNSVFAFYSGILQRVVTSTCGYSVLYMTHFIAFDRCIGLTFFCWYQKFNKPRVAKILISVGVGLSFVVHSWSPWFENQVIEIRSEDNSTVFSWQKPSRRKDSVFQELFMIKNVYNGAVRISYPIILTLVTAVVCVKFWKQQKRRATLLRGNQSQDNSIKTKGGSTFSLLSRSGRKRMDRTGSLRRRSNEKCLFFLMIAVVILAFIQVIPREGHRILQFIYPIKEITPKIVDTSLDFDYRLKLFKIALYGHEVMKILMNFCTAVDRSLTFYLYFALNPSFRHECLRILSPRGAANKLLISVFGTGGTTSCPERTALRPDALELACQKEPALAKLRPSGSGNGGYNFDPDTDCQL